MIPAEAVTQRAWGSRLRRRSMGALPLLGVGLAACASPVSLRPAVSGAATAGALVANPAKNEWPSQFWQSPPETQEAYRFALANQQVLQYMPCFCGCVDQGHQSNKDCYIRQARPDGSFLLEPMSFG
jgi:hypothetical protein